MARAGRAARRLRRIKAGARPPAQNGRDQSGEAVMPKLAAMLYVIVAPVVMGVLFTVALMIDGLNGGAGLGVAALVGAVVAAPLSWQAAKAIMRQRAG